LVFSSWRDTPFNKNHVKQLRQILLRHSQRDSRHRGQYKTHSNSVVELNKEAYYLAVRQTQGSIRTEAPDWQPWLVFFLRSLSEQVRRLEKKVEREKTVLAALPELLLHIVELAREHGRVTMGDAIKLTGVSRNTLNQLFRRRCGPHAQSEKLIIRSFCLSELEAAIGVAAARRWRCWSRFCRQRAG